MLRIRYRFSKSSKLDTIYINIGARIGACLRVVRRRDTIDVGGNLGAQVRDANELLQHVLGHDVGEAGLADVLAVDVDVVDAQVQVGGGDGAHAPVRLGPKHLLLIWRRGRHDEPVAVHVLHATKPHALVSAHA